MHAPVAEVHSSARASPRLVERILGAFDWRLPMSPLLPGACSHGGAFFDAIGRRFEALERRHGVINADVLDAWFPPSPRALAAVGEHLEWALRTSPPTGCEGMVETIAEMRVVPAGCVLPGGGSSNLIFLALTRWLRAGDRALVLDPAYGEYAHLLESVIGCQVERFELRREEGWQIDPERLGESLSRGYDIVVLVNPNSPTGVHLPRSTLAHLLEAAPASTRIWLDETYVDYAGPEQSLEAFAAASRNVVVCKSMSKAYALSGARCAYLCAPARIVDELRRLTPPWTIGLVGQLAAVEALRDTAYYEERWRETAQLRVALAGELARLLRAEVVPGAANFLLLHLPPDGLRPEEISRRCRARGLFLRTFEEMPRLGHDALRIAVKDRETNRRMLAILAEAAAP
jgi:histidinol-phosphate/aromatic aminotransferase/cobyric acid decarboxylase-like protein